MLMPRDKELLRFIEKNKAITIYQAASLFYGNNYKSASRRLKQLEDEGHLRSYISTYNKQKAYYMLKPLSSHDLVILDVYSELVRLGAKVLEFRAAFQENNGLSYLKGFVKPDGYFQYQYKDYIDSFFLEVDYTHFTGQDKFILYEKMKEDNILTGDFPAILVLRPTELDYRYESEEIDIIYGNMSLKGNSLQELILN